MPRRNGAPDATEEQTVTGPVDAAADASQQIPAPPAEQNGNGNGRTRSENRTYVQGVMVGTPQTMTDANGVLHARFQLRPGRRDGSDFIPDPSSPVKLITTKGTQAEAVRDAGRQGLFLVVTGYVPDKDWEPNNVTAFDRNGISVNFGDVASVTPQAILSPGPLATPVIGQGLA